MNLGLRILVSAIAIGIAARVVPNVEVDSFFVAIIVAIVLSVINGFIGTILRIMTLPLNILTLGLVSCIISVLMIMLTSYVIDGFGVTSFWGAAIFAIVLSLVNMIFGVNNDVFKKKR